MFNSRDESIDYKEKKLSIEIPYEIGTIVMNKNNSNDLAVISQYRIIKKNNKQILKVGLNFDIYNQERNVEKEVELDEFKNNYIKSDRIIVRNINESELIRIPEISKYYKNNKMAVFNNCIFKDSNFDVDEFLRIYKESRNLEKYEIKCLMALCEMGKVFNLSDDLILGPGHISCCNCLFKTNDFLWITWETDERRGFDNAKLFLDVYDACISIICENVPKKQIYNALKYFKFLLYQDVDEQSLIEFVQDKNYVYSKSKVKKMK